MQERADLPKTKNQNINVKYQNLEEENGTGVSHLAKLRVSQ